MSGGKVFGYICLIILGIGLGQAVFQKGVPDPVVIHDTKTVTETEYVTEYVEVEADPAVVERAPDSCWRVATQGRDAAKAANRLSTNATLTLDLISEARQAMQLQDINALNNIETQLRDFGEQGQEDLTTIADATLDFDTDYLDCETHR